jgi:hypothetical protein
VLAGARARRAAAAQDRPAAEDRAVESLLRFAPGVTDVRNEMTLSRP